MTPLSTLAFAGDLHQRLRRHLFPGDGLEAAAILLCSRTPPSRQRLLAQDMILIPYNECASRTATAITWPGECIEQAIDLGEARDLSLILTHSHPGGLLGFSSIDDASDRRVLPAVFQAYGDVHGSAVMIENGVTTARLCRRDLRPAPIDLVTVAGDDLSYWWHERNGLGHDRPIAFTSAMTRELGRLTAVVVGISGTGSIVAEQAARLGFGRVVLIDFDRIEAKNLNRILNATLRHAKDGMLKVDALAEAIEAHRGAGAASPISGSLASRDAVLAASQGDVLFSCVDSVEGRQLCDLVAAAFLLPLFDVGVVIPTRTSDGRHAIADVFGRVDYVQPGGATLFVRAVWTPEMLRAEYLRQVAPAAHREELEAGYIKGLVEEAPSVITLNMRAASAMMNEFVARAYPFRHDPNHLYARTTFSLAACEEEYVPEHSFPRSANPLLARGDREPLLNLPSLKKRKKELAA